MKIATSDRSVARRLSFKAPLRVRIWKSAGAESRAESVDLSEKGIFFATDSLLKVGTQVQVLLKMPEEITGEPATECCAMATLYASNPSNPTPEGWASVCNLIAMRSPVQSSPSEPDVAQSGKLDLMKSSGKRSIYAESRALPLLAVCLRNVTTICRSVP